MPIYNNVDEKTTIMDGNKTTNLNIKPDTKVSVRSIGSMKSELVKLQAELKELDVNSKAFTKASGRARKLETGLKEVGTSMEGMDSAIRASEMGHPNSYYIST